MRCALRVFIISLLLNIVLSSVAFAVTSPQTFTMDGQLFLTGTTTPLTDATAKIRVYVMNPAGTCLLYVEEQTVDTLTSNGYFNIQVGSDTGSVKRVVGLDPGRTMLQVYQNNAAITANSVPGQTCAGGVYTPTNGDGRLVRMIVTPTSGSPDPLTPDLVMDLAPMSKVAETIQGIAPAALLQVNNSGSVSLTQTNLEAMFTGTAYTNLQSVMAGTFGAGAASSLNALAGTAAAPSMTFSADSDTGFFSSGTNQIGISSSGVNIFNIGASGIVSSTTGGAALSTAVGTESAPSLSFAGDLDTGWFRPGANTMAASTGGAERMRIDPSGKVGIGTTAPISILDVSSGAATSAITVHSSTTGYGTTDGLEVSTGVGGVGYLWNYESAALRFGTNNADRMLIGATGNIGIGTTSPSAKLEVAGDMRLNGATSGYVGFQAPAVAGSATYTLPVTDGTVGQVLRTSGSGVLSWVSVSTTSMVADSGTAAAPSIAFSGDLDTGIFSPGADTFAVSASGIERLSVDVSGISARDMIRIAGTGSGFVGLRAPSAAGSTIYTLPSSDGSANAVLTTNGTGILSWTTASTTATAVIADSGTAAAPSIAFSGDANTGFYHAAADRIGVATNGASIFILDASGMVSPTTGGGAVSTANGTVSAPTYSFAGDLDTGIFRPAADTVGIVTNGAEGLRVSATGAVGVGTTSPTSKLQVAGDIRMDGATSGYVAFKAPAVAGSATYTFPVTDGSANQVLTTSGSGDLTWTSVASANGVLAIDGSAGGPSIAFSADTNTGLFRPGNDQIGVAVNGASIFILDASGMVSPTTGGAAVGTAAGAVGTPTYSFAGDLNTGIFRPAADTVGIVTNGAEGLRVSATGAVGIGTTTPVAKLDLAGDMRFNGATSGYVGFQAPAVAGSATYTLPVTDGSANQFLRTDGTGILSWATPSTVATSVLASAGALTTPSIAFSGDADTGMWSPGADSVAISASGVERLRVDASGITTKDTVVISGSTSGFVGVRAPAVAGSGILTLPATVGTSGQVMVTDGSGVLSWTSPTAATFPIALGTSGTPSMNFSGDTNTGIYSPGADQVGVAANGALLFTLDASGMVSPTTGGAAVGTAAGAVGTPTYSFAGDLNTGIFRPAADTVGIVTNGAEGLRVSATGAVGIGTTSPIAKFEVTGAMRLNGTTSGYVGFQAPATSGSATYTWPAADGSANQVLRTDGTGILSWVTPSTVATSVLADSGTVSAPSIAFSGDANTGVWSPGADSVAISASGVERLRVDASGITAKDTVVISGSTSGYFALKAPAVSGSSTYTFPVNDGSANQVLTTSGSGDLTWTSVSTGTTGLALGTSAAPAVSFSGDLNTGIYSPGAESIALVTTGTERVRVDASGYVGVGTTAPTAPMHVVSVNNGAGLKVTSNGGLNMLEVHEPSGNRQVSISDGSTTGILVGPNPNGIQLNLNNDAPVGININATASHASSVLTIGSIKTVFTNPSTAVGIGTTSPSARLHVMEEIRVGGSTSGYVGIRAPAVAGSGSLTLPATVGTSGQVMVTDGSGVLSWTSPTAATFPIALGTSGTPSMNFSGDTDTGVYSPAADIVAVSASGIERLRVDASGVTAKDTVAISGSTSGYVAFKAPAVSGSATYTLPVTDGSANAALTTNGAGVLTWTVPSTTATTVIANSGSAATPSIAFSGDTDTGFYNAGANQIGIAASGAQIFAMSASGMVSPTTGGGAISTANGTVSAPTFSFGGDLDTGIFRPGADTVAIAASGVERFRVDASGITAKDSVIISGSTSGYVAFKSPAVSGSATYTLPATDGSANQFLRTDGTGILSWVTPSTTATSVIADSGSTTVPSIAFSGDANTGMWSPGADTVAISASGVERFRVDASGITTKDTVVISGSTSGFVGVRAPAVAGSGILTLPATVGTSGQVMVTDGSGVLSWTSPTAATFPIALGTSGTPSMNFSGDTNTGIYSPGADTVAISTSGVESLRVSATGAVGIGTTAPTAKLEVVGAANILVSNTDAEGVKIHSVYSDNETSSRVLFAERQDNQYGWSMVAAGVNNPVLGGTTMTGLPASTFNIVAHNASAAGSPVVSISRDGLVGIGTTTPGAKLDVKDTIRVSGSTSGYVGIKAPAVAGSGVLTLPATVGTSGQVMVTDGSGVLSWTSPTAATFPIALGTSGTPSMNFSGDTNTGIYSPGADIVAISSSGVERMRVDASGITAKDTLAISGSTSGYVAFKAPAVSGSATYTLPATDGSANYVLATNGAGTLSWASVLSATTGLALGTSAAPSISFSGDLNTGIYSPGAETAALVTNGAERVRVDASGYVGIGTTAPTSLVHVQRDQASETVLKVLNGSSSAGAKAMIRVGYTDAIGLDIFRNGDGADVYFNATQGNGKVRFQDAGADTVTIDESGNLGIGTTAPGAKLQVTGGDIRISGSTSGYVGLKAPAVAGSGILTLPATVGTSGQTMVTDGSGVLSWATPTSATFPIALGTSGTPSMNFSGDTDTGIYSPGANLVAISTSGVERMRLSGSNIGIGITTPLYPLHIYADSGGATATAFAIESSNSAGYSGSLAFILNPSGGGGPYTGGSISVENSNNGGANDGGILKFYTAAQDGSHTQLERMRVNSSGNVGIGVSALSARLQIAGGDFRIDGSTSGYVGLRAPAVAGSGILTLPSAVGTSGQVMVTDGSGVLSWVSPTSTVFPIALGTSGTPSMNFSGDTNTGIYSPGADMVAISTSGAERLRVNASGFVGIGNVTPAYPLDIFYDQNATTAIRLRNNDSGASSAAMIGLNAYGNAWGIRVGSSANNANSLDFVIDAFGTPISKMRINATGNVGIGTISPSSAIHIYSSSDSVLQRADSSQNAAVTVHRGFTANSGTAAQIQYNLNNNTANAYFTLQGSGYTPSGTFDQANGLGIRTDGAGGIAIGAQNGAGNIRLYAGGNGDAYERLRILPSGNVGIGVVNPGAKLHVMEEVRVGGSTSGYVGIKAPAVAGSGTLTLPATVGTSGQVMVTDGSGVLSWATASGGGGGTTGIALGSSSAPSISFSGDANTGIYSPAAEQIAISTSGVERFLFNGTDMLMAEGHSLKFTNSNNHKAGFYQDGNFQSSWAEGFFVNWGGTERVILTGSLDGASNGGIGAPGALQVYGQQGVTLATPKAGTDKAFVLRTDVSNAGAYWYDAGTGNEVMTITGAGNVGIGVTTPAAKLHVMEEVRVGGSTSGYVGIRAPAVAGSGTLTLPATVGTSGQVMVTDGSGVLSWATASGGGGGTTGIALGSSSAPSISFSGDANTGIYSPGADLIAIATSGVEALRVSASGYVGIGTTNPTNALTVAGDGTISITNKSNWTSSYGQIRHAGGHLYIEAGTNGIDFTDGSGNVAISMLSSGYLGIGTTAPTRPLEVVGYIRASNSFQFDGSDGAVLQANNGTVGGAENILNVNNFGSAWGEPSLRQVVTFPTHMRSSVGLQVTGATNGVGLTVDTGKVGIGTTDPQAKLDVKDTIRISGSTSGYVGLKAAAAAGSTTYTFPTADGGAGQILSTDGSGNLTWVADAGGSSGNFPIAIGSSGSPTMNFTGDTNTGIYSPGADQVAVTTGGVQRVLIDASGITLPGTTSGFVGLRAPAVAGSGILTLPATVGTSGQTMVTDGSGNLAWAAAGGGGTLTKKVIYSGITYTTSDSAPSGGCTAPTEYTMNDGVVSSKTTWGSETDVTPWIKADLGSVKTIDTVWLGGEGPNSCWGDAQSYWLASNLVQVSSDNSTWTTVLTGSDIAYSNTEIKPFSFTSTTARYVRIYNPGNIWMAVGQFRIGIDGNYTELWEQVASTAYNGMNVGIGTTTADARLHVRNSTGTGATAIVEGGGQYSSLRIQSTNRGTGSYLELAGNDETIGNYDASTIRTVGMGGDLFLESSSGRVNFRNSKLFIGLGSTDESYISMLSTGHGGNGEAASRINYGLLAFSQDSNSDTLMIDTGSTSHNKPLFRVYEGGIPRVHVKGNGGFVGIGTSNPSALLTVDNGTTIGTYTTGGWNHSSDFRLKKDVKTIDQALDRVVQLRGVEYKFTKDKENRNQIGFIAQEAEKVFPESVTTGPDGMKSMSYANLVAPVVEAIKELYKKVQDLFKKSDAQSRDVAALQEKAKSLEKENSSLKTKVEKAEKFNDAMKAYLCAKDPKAAFCK